MGPRKHHYRQTSGDDGIPAELFQILIDDAVKVLQSMPVNLENSAVVIGLKKVSFHFNPKKRQCQSMFKYGTMALISHASEVMLKILQVRLQQYLNQELPDVQTGFKRQRKQRSNCKHLLDHRKS